MGIVEFAALSHGKRARIIDAAVQHATAAAIGPSTPGSDRTAQAIHQFNLIRALARSDVAILSGERLRDDGDDHGGAIGRAWRNASNPVPVNTGGVHRWVDLRIDVSSIVGPLSAKIRRAAKERDQVHFILAAAQGRVGADACIRSLALENGDRGAVVGAGRRSVQLVLVNAGLRDSRGVNAIGEPAGWIEPIAAGLRCSLKMAEQVELRTTAAHLNLPWAASIHSLVLDHSDIGGIGAAPCVPRNPVLVCAPRIDRSIIDACVRLSRRVEPSTSCARSAPDGIEEQEGRRGAACLDEASASRFRLIVDHHADDRGVRGTRTIRGMSVHVVAALVDGGEQDARMRSDAIEEPQSA